MMQTNLKNDFRSFYINTTSNLDRTYKWQTGDTFSYSFTIPYDNYVIDWNFKKLTVENVPKEKLALKIEEAAEGYIQDNCDRNTIIEYGHHIYSVIQEKVCDIAYNIISKLEEEYTIENIDAIIDVVIDEINFNSLFEIADSILDEPVSFEDKLAEVGMSIKDFI